MLIEELTTVNKRLSLLSKKETTLLDAEKKTQNDKDFATLTSTFYSSILKVKYANEELGYSLSDDSLQLADDTLGKLQEIIKDNIVDEDQLPAAKIQVNKKLSSQLSADWKEYHSKRTSPVVRKLATIESLSTNKAEISKIRDNINNASDWGTLLYKVDPETNKIQQLKKNIDAIDKIENQLNLTDDVRRFITLVSSGKARISDLNDTILDWIKQENLNDKFAIRYR